MVRDPSRYCKCIPDYQLESMFCEARPTGFGLRNEIQEDDRTARGLIDEIKEGDKLSTANGLIDEIDESDEPSTASIVSQLYQ